MGRIWGIRWKSTRPVRPRYLMAGDLHLHRNRLERVAKLLWQASNSLIFAIRAGAGYGIAC